MLRTYIYVPDELAEQVNRIAQINNSSKADVIRTALAQGLSASQNNIDASIQAMFKIAEIGKKYKLKGPKNSSQRIDELLWGKDWSKDE